MDYMIKTISCSLIGLIFGGDSCRCNGYDKKSLPNPKFTQKIIVFPEAKRISQDFLTLESWCYNLVCKQSFEFWHIECSFNKGTPLVFCKDGFFKRYAITTPNLDGII